MKHALRAILWISAAAGAALAQNSELGLLIGPSVFRSQTPPSAYSNYVTFTGQANYAIQLHEGGKGRLYLEMPVLVDGAAVEIPIGNLTITRIGGRLYAAPGVRWKWMASSRWSLYGAAGAGIRKGSILRGTMDVAAGVDLRATRLFSFRVESRMFVTPNLPSNVAAFHSFFQFGGVLHF